MSGNTTPILLASSSEYRKKQLFQLGLPFESASPHCDERALAGETPKDLALRLSREKAHSLASEYPSHIIIGSDQTAACNGVLLGKPLTEDNAIAQLAMCRGQTVEFFSGICALNTSTGRELADTIRTSVKFRNLSDAQIRAYIQREQPLYCAGSFKCESLGISLFESINSEDPSALIGLPLIRLNHFLIDFGIDVLR
ncbi:Maf-like protein YceF [Thalassocella blandensis]|nr:Maf-like protein YceF [Thalassocella blandensis]